jgi:HAD superfamily hydrolase (TIGR01484 family)
MQEIRLIATDLDGTIIGSANELPLYTIFRDRINELRRRYNAIWVVCTGRSLHAFRDYFTPMRMMGAVPDYVIIRHAYIYSVKSFGYLPHLFWNLHIHYLLWLSYFNTREAINEWHEMVSHFSSGVTTVKKGKYRLWLRFDSEESASSVAAMLKEKVKAYHHLQVFKYLMEVDVRPVPFTKGLAVSELAQHLGVSRDRILAIGNGHNDISMLDGKTAGLTGCPANSEAEVVDVVHQAGGHIASRNSLAGVLEILQAYMTDAVKSDLPIDWEDPTQTANSRTRRSIQHRDKMPLGVNPWMLGVAVYTVLLVFAIYVPFPLSSWIAKPYWLLVAMLERFASWLTG